MNRGKKKVTFKLHASFAREVFVSGTFNEWDASSRPLRKDDDGLWSASCFLQPGRYEYRFVIDGIWADDPSCTSHCPNIYGGENCLLIIE